MLVPLVLARVVLTLVSRDHARSCVVFASYTCCARARAHVVFARVVRVCVPVLVFVLTYVHLLLVIVRTTVL